MSPIPTMIIHQPGKGRQFGQILRQNKLQGYYIKWNACYKKGGCDSTYMSTQIHKDGKKKVAEEFPDL